MSPWETHHHQFSSDGYHDGLALRGVFKPVYDSRASLGMQPESPQMKYSALLAAIIFAFAALPAQARLNCNHNPVCQAQRDGTSVAEARKKDQAMTACL